MGKENFEWIVDKVAKLAVKKALSPEPVELRWASLLGGAKSAKKKAAKKKSVVEPIEMAVLQDEPLK